MALTTVILKPFSGPVMPLPQLPKHYKPFTDADSYPVGTVVRLLKTNEFAIVRAHTYQHNKKGFLNYLCEIEGREQGARCCCFHHDLAWEHFPKESNKKCLS